MHGTAVICSFRMRYEVSIRTGGLEGHPTLVESGKYYHMLSPTEDCLYVGRVV
jgi:hypothetical protein